MGFEVKVEGDGGMEVVWPIARLYVGGSVGRKVRILEAWPEGSGK